MANSATIADVKTQRMTNFRWVICALLFLATAVNYMDRQVLSLTWKDFIAPEFHWTDTDYGNITAVFSIVYAIANLFAGRFIDWMGTKKGYLWAIFIWSAGACLHALCGWATEHTLGFESASQMVSASGAVASTIAITSVYYFIAARIILAVGEGGNFPAAVKVTAEYFPKKDRAYSTSIFNAGSTIGALAAPLSIPPLARYFQNLGIGNGWEMAFMVIGALGFIWMGLWMFYYKKPAENPRVNAEELAYIEQDNNTPEESAQKKAEVEDSDTAVIPFLKCFMYPQTWAVFFGKFMTDGVWWFFLFWAPGYFQDVYGYKASSGTGMLLIMTLYAIVTFLSIYICKLPTYFVDKKGMNPYAGRMLAMMLIAFIPLVCVAAQPMGEYSAWWPAIIIGLVGAGHQAWSANIFSTVGDMFPKSAIATVTGIGGMAGGVGSFLINKGSGQLFTFAEEQGEAFTFLGFDGKPAGYMIVFCICAVAYLLAWCIMKVLVPKYKPIVVE